MFSFSITQQLIVFLQSFGFGFIIGCMHLIIDFICSLLLPVKAKTIVSDSVFCFVFSVMTFCFVLAYNLGKLRLYVVLGILLGVILFFVTLGEAVSGFLSRVTGFISSLRHLVIGPLRKLREFFKTKLNKSIAKENESSV